MIEGTYEQFAPYWDANLAVQSDPIHGQLIYLDEKEFPRAQRRAPGGFYRQLLRGGSEKLGFLALTGAGKVTESTFPFMQFMIWRSQLEWPVSAAAFGFEAAD